MLIEEQDLVAYLTGKGIQVSRATGSEVQVHCWNCPDGDPKGKGRLYFNTESWLGHCKRCDIAYNRKTLLEHFGDEDGLQHAPGADPMLRRKILTEAAELAHDMLLGNDAKLQYLLDRGIAPEVVVERKFGYVPRNVGLSDMLPSRERFTFKDLIAAGLVTVGGKEFFNDALTIPYWSHGTVVQLREKQIDGKYRTVAGDQPRLYNSDALLGATEVLIVEGEFDTDAIRSAMLQAPERTFEGLAVVGLAGANTWPDGLVESLQSVGKVFIGLDPDETGKKAAAKLAGEVGNKARTVELPEGLPKTDWSDVFSAKTTKNPHGGKDWRFLKDSLTEADLAGKRLFSIDDLALKWQRRKTEAPGLQTGWKSLDTIIRPGLRPGQVVIPLAGTGVGKSVWLSNLTHNLRDEGVLYISLELTGPEVFEHLFRIHKFWFPKATPDERQRDYRLFQVADQNRIGRGDLADYIGEYEEATGRRPKAVILDYLQYYARGFRGSSAYERVSDAIMEVKAVAKEEGVVIIVPSQVNRAAEEGKPLNLSQARDGGTIEETGDFVIALFRPDLQVTKDPNGAPLQQTGQMNMQLLKSRHGGKGRVFNLVFSPMSLAIVDKMFDKPNALRVDQELRMHLRGLHYEDYRQQLDDAEAQDSLLEATL